MLKDISMINICAIFVKNQFMNPILIAIMAATVLFSYKGFTDLAFFRKYEFHIGSIKAGEQIRMFSSAFLHADWNHSYLFASFDAANMEFIFSEKCQICKTFVTK